MAQAAEDAESVLVTVGEGIAVLTLNRPAQRNAMSAGMVRRLLAVLPALERDGAVGAIVLEGAGKGFCAGSDLGGLAAMDDEARSAFEAESGRLARLLAQLSLPVVAAVHGFAIGGGLTLAAGCDIVVTQAQARWSLPEVPIGLFPAWGLGIVTQRIGVAAARRLAWGIDTHDGVAAVALGLADQVAEVVAATAIARQLAALPRAQCAAVKRYFATDPAGEAGDMLANRLFAEASRSPQALASLERFAAKPG